MSDINHQASAPQKKQKRLTLAFLYANVGEAVLKQLGEEESYTRIFSEEGKDEDEQKGIVQKIRDYHEGKLTREDFATQGEFMSQVVTPVMDAFLDAACPSAKTKPQIAQWVCKQYLSHRHNGKPIMAEDLYKIGENIAYFDGLKNSPAFKETGANADLLQYKTYAAFEEMLEPHLQRKAEKEELAKALHMKEEERVQLIAETTVLYDGPEGKVVVPHTPTASKYWGSNTKWCITYTDDSQNMFSFYNKESPIIMILPKRLYDDKIALVGRTLYNSADVKIAVLPQPHDDLMQHCLAGLSDDARKGIAPWIPNTPFSPKREQAQAPIVTTQEPWFVLLQPPKDPVVEAALLEVRDFEWYYAMDGGQFSAVVKRLDPSLWRNRDFVLAAIKLSSSAFEYAADELKRDREFALAAVRESGQLKYVAEELKNDHEIVLAAVSKNWQALKYASERLKSDHEIVLTAVGQHGLALQHASEELQNNRDFILAAVKRNGKALQYVAEALKDDREIGFAAVRQDIDVLKHVGEEAKKDSVFVIRLLEEMEDFPFDIGDRKEEGIWQPDDATLIRCQIKALEKMAQRGDREKLIKYTRHCKSTWGDADTLFATDPAAALKLKEIRAETVTQYPLASKPSGPRLRM